MPRETDAKKLERYEAALDQFIERIAEDRYVLAVVLVGSLSPETIWHREIAGPVDHRGRRRQPAPAERRQGRTRLPHPGRERHQHSRRGDPAQPVQEDGRRGVADGVLLQLLRRAPDRLQQGPVHRQLVQAGQQRRDQGPGAGTPDLLDVDHPRAPPRAEAPGHQGRPRTGGAGNRWGPPTAWPTPRSSARARCGNRTSSTGRSKGTRSCSRRSTSTCWPSARIGACCPRRSTRSTGISTSTTRPT